MTRPLTVSVVIVSRHRPDALRRCLISLAQQLYDAFEVIVVADPASCTGLRSVPQAAHARVIPCDAAHVPEARNRGIAAAAGEIVAFIDDGSAAEPTWLNFLVAPFGQPDVAAVGGFVRARNGISWRSRARWVDSAGQTGPIEVDGARATVLHPSGTRAIRTEGTNMAVRRGVLERMGGFDPAIRSDLHVVDLNLRLAEQGLCTAIAPLAQVHQGFAGTARQPVGRGRGDLREIGAGWAVFLRKHHGSGDHSAIWDRIFQDERRRALSGMVRGDLEPRDVRRLLQNLSDGRAEGAKRGSENVVPLPLPEDEFRPYRADQRRSAVVIAGRFWSRRAMRLRARDLVASRCVTLIRLSPTALYHKMRFTTGGYWEQTGGLFGKSDRNQRVFTYWTFNRRVRFELDRVRAVRGILDRADGFSP